MARQSTSGRASGSTATKNVPGNQTPNTPDVNESEIARLKVDQLRDRLRRRGITGTGDMRKDDLVKALIKALREGRKTTRSGSGSRSGSTGGTGTTARRGPGSGSGTTERRRSASGGGTTARRTSGGSGAGRRGSGEQPGNQTPNTPEINESEIARLKVDELREQLRRHGVTGTAGMRKPELVDALIRALTSGGPTEATSSGRRNGRTPGDRSERAGERTEAIPMPAAPQARPAVAPEAATPGTADTARDTGRGPAAERRATGAPGHAPEALPAGPAHAELEAGAAPAALPAAPAHSGQPTAPQREVRIPRFRTAPDDIEEAPRLQPVRSPEPTTGSGPSVTAETADRVLTDLMPAEMEPVDEVVTPEGTVISAVDEAVATPPLPGTER